MPVTELLSGLVTGEFWSGSIDTASDPDLEPDYSPAEGGGIIVPSIRTLQVVRANGSRYNVQLRNFPFVLTDGLVTTSDQTPLRLIANVNQYAETNPVDWYWKVTQFTADGIAYADFAIDVDPLSDCDLTAYSPLPTTDATLKVMVPGVTQAEFDAALTSGAFLGFSIAGLP